MKRHMNFPPLVEFIFEIRWSHPDGLDQLIDEHQLSVGDINKIYKSTHRHESVFAAPREVMKQILSQGDNFLICDRFMPIDTPKGKLDYPLYQYGVGIASLNLNNTAYSWQEALRLSTNYFMNLCNANDGLNDRISSISIRSLDLFNTTDLCYFLDRELGIKIETPLDKLEFLNIETSVPVYIETWDIKEFPGKMRIQAGPGTSGNQKGILLDIFIAEENPRIPEGGSIQDKLKTMHHICGDVFFKLLNNDLRKKLGYYETAD